jgi:hypothetical protein
MGTITIATHTITQSNAAHVLHVLRLDGGMPCGSFVEKVIEATLIADAENQRRLSLGFEGLVAAVQVYKKLNSGTEILQQIAAGQPFLLVVEG